MPTDPSDGIDALEQKRLQRRRPLPSQHPPAEPATGVAQPQPTAGTAEPGQPAARPAPRRQRRPARRETESVPLRLGQFYVTADQDEALRKIRATGLMANMDVSGSAVVRYALDQLLATKTPDELVQLLGTPKGQKQDRRGRPRR